MAFHKIRVTVLVDGEYIVDVYPTVMRSDPPHRVTVIPAHLMGVPKPAGFLAKSHSMGATPKEVSRRLIDAVNLWINADWHLTMSLGEWLIKTGNAVTTSDKFSKDEITGRLTFL